MNEAGRLTGSFSMTQEMNGNQEGWKNRGKSDGMENGI
jgi:hypothetical protein